jgi:hypothetical protein
MNFASINGTELRKHFIELHKDVFDAGDIDDTELMDHVFEQWIDKLLDEGVIQAASMNN